METKKKINLNEVDWTNLPQLPLTPGFEQRKREMKAKLDYIKLQKKIKTLLKQNH